MSRADRAQALDPLHFPLWGSRLIEASAGTGKTYTIAALYLRLVLGHGREDEAFDRPLMPPEILVMTFTKAATRELSDRIRQRLQAAAQCFRGETPPDPSDSLLMALLDAHGDDKARELAAWRLGVAAESMDEAAIHTIDAWCQRMLREHAFDSGNLFDEELMVNEKRLLEEASRDYWRQKIYPLRGEALEAALSVWPSVDALIAGVQPLLEHARPQHGRGDDLADVIAQAHQERLQALAGLKAGWEQRADDMRDWIAAQLARPDCPFAKSKLKLATVDGWLQSLKQWAADAAMDEPAMTKTALERLTPTGLRSICDSSSNVELHPHFEAFAVLQAALLSLPGPARTLRLHAAACVQARLDALKRQAGTYGFKDMVDRLGAALAGPNAERLRAGILAQYPVALVDEFQDTSPTQYRIFDALYRTKDNDPRTALLLIGDPKQSIYAFRGADIDSYLAARAATMGRHYMLGTNFRSTTELVQAVNRVFQFAEDQHGRGAFMFGRAAGGGPGLLPFEPVHARGRQETFVRRGDALPALSIVHDGRAASKRVSQARFASLCAEDIAQLLNDATAGFSTSERFAPIRPADVAVLVRDRHEAEAVRSELGRRGIASVYLSDQDSVFSSEEAVDLLRWLRAVEQPLDLRLVRAALATRTVGLPLAELARMAVDDEAFELRAAEVRRLHDVWLQQGILTMLRQTLHSFELPSRWLQQPGGERRLTNVLHLAELIQVAATQLDGEAAVIHWLRDQIEGEAAAGEEQIVRLESDADLVQVITVYKSKGLEYPLVYLPFACAFRPVDKRGRKFIALADGQGGRHLDFNLLQESIDAADEERLKEDLRLLYVALTRARHRVWVGAGSIGVGRGMKVSTHRSALGYLLSGGDSIGADELKGRLEQAYGASPGIELLEASGSNPEVSMLQRRQVGPELVDAPPYTARFPKDWSIGSFSAMVRHIIHVPAAQALADLATQEELLAESLDDEFDGRPPAVVDEGAPWHRFPRGAMPGNFLHNQLEWLATEGFALNASPDLSAQLLRRCERQGWGHRGQDVVDWLSALLATPLGNAGATLEQLGTRGSALPEMEFWFPSEGLESRELDDACRRHTLEGRARAALPRRRLEGMLMGFADLVFEQDGRYWVLDYKSNALGSGDRHYGKPALEAAMAQHRYDVQAALYMLALHRLLRQRLGGAYDPEQHLGGAIYLFMRGLRSPTAGSYVVRASSDFLDELDALVGHGRQERG